MDEIIEMLTEKVTTDRPSLFGALEIDWKSIEDNLPTGESLKKRTGACLNTWFTEQQVKYWKYQELLLTFRDSNLDSGANSIIERFGIKELKDARNYFEAAKQEALPLGKEKDSHLYANTSFVGSSDKNQQILIQQNPTEKNCLRKETNVENGECKKKVKASIKETITETEEDMEIEHFDNIESKDMGTNSVEDATVTDGIEKSLIHLRDYQQELAVLALKGENTIICAGTNAGKTYVALKVIESHLEKNTTGTVVFMTRTNVLLGQQFDTACKLLPGLSSKGKIQKWEAGQDFTSVTFKSLVNRCSILFLTPKSLCNFLEDDFSRVNIDQFTLLVLDECHHTYGKSPYNEIMGHYRKKKFENEQNNLPQIMGLTASPGTNRAKDKFGAKEHLLHIMTNLDVKELSVVKNCESSLLEYSSKPARVTTYLNNPINEAEGLFEALRNPPKDRTIERYTLWLSNTKKNIEAMLKNETQALRLMHACFRHLEFYAECLEVNSLLDITHIRTTFKDGVKKLKEESIKATDEKEKELIEFLDAKALAEKLPEEFKSRHLTGSQVSKEEGGLSKEEQIDVVKRFKEGKHLCLVATSVASEGLDIQQCTLTIRYRLQANEISSLQMRGRIRHQGGKEVLIGSQEELEREELNIERLFLMNLAIDEVLKEDVSQKIATSERNIYEMEELARQRLKTNPNSEKKGKFYITCALCGKFVVDGQYIRRIRKAHCIICDKEIFDKIDRRKTKKSQTFDENKENRQSLWFCMWS
ncbi:IFIH1 [Mytilus edulis]|uniref:IFIH1 n=1 Tax=Mytilus edulis TaxID=6550 RepID=A0A8S3PMC0_MYTED|nr:IFIH1 [Mytilus edulis]